MIKLMCRFSFEHVLLSDEWILIGYPAGFEAGEDWTRA
jgi:hypothetical protein